MPDFYEIDLKKAILTDLFDKIESFPSSFFCCCIFNYWKKKKFKTKLRVRSSSEVFGANPVSKKQRKVIQTWMF